MVFPNQLKLDRHIQYSLVHKKNVEAQQPDKDKDKWEAPAAEAAVAAVASPATPLPSVLDMDVSACIATCFCVGYQAIWKLPKLVGGVLPGCYRTTHVLWIKIFLAVV